MKRLWIGIQGSPERVEDFVKRLGYICQITKRRPTKDKGEGQISVSVTCYTSYGDAEPSNLVDIVAAQDNQIQELQTTVGQLELEVQRLKQELAILPKPRPYDVVLGSQNVSPARNF